MVYMLRCCDGSLYTGTTSNIEVRLKDHRAGKASKYTRARLPLHLVYQEPCVSKSVALKREYAIKQLPKVEKEALVDSEGVA